MSQQNYVFIFLSSIGIIIICVGRDVDTHMQWYECTYEFTLFLYTEFLSLDIRAISVQIFLHTTHRFTKARLMRLFLNEFGLGLFNITSYLCNDFLLQRKRANPYVMLPALPATPSICANPYVMLPALPATPSLCTANARLCTVLRDL
jgi:hypothetical protein